MSRKDFVALIKAYRGGEWLECSLESVWGHTDGAVVVLGETSWVPEVSGANNCRRPLESFRLRHPEYPVVICDATPGAQSSTQCDIGLDAISSHFGPETAVLILDTDEVWAGDSLEALRDAVWSNPGIHYFRSSLHSYVKSPLYQVWPLERPNPCVALQHAKPQNTYNRFAVTSPQTLMLPDIVFHHFTYVRESEADLRDKFQTTSSQEKIPSDPTWWERVWPGLPAGRNLHMTPGFEHCWREIKVLPDVPVDLPVFCATVIAEEDERWKGVMEREPPASTLIPTPNDADAAKYQEFACLAPDVQLLRKRLKMTYLEALIVHAAAKHVPAEGAVLEIGSGTGGSLACVALGTKAQLWAVDPFTPYDEKTHAGIARGVREGNEAAFWETASAYSFADRVRHIKHNSDVAAAECPNEGFDLIIIDGNHSDEIVLGDLRAYWPKLKHGGLFLFHDYTTRFPGVIWAAKQWGIPYSVFAGTSMAYARKPL
jgi:predicted O-methyltransferase YrrM